MSRLQADLVSAAGFGFLVGGLTVLGVYRFYPPPKGDFVHIPLVAGVSLVSILALYVVSGRLGLLRVGDWLVLGYACALVLAASLIVSREVAVTLRAHVPENLGVKTSAVSSVEWHG